MQSNLVHQKPSFQGEEDGKVEQGADAFLK